MDGHDYELLAAATVPKAIGRLGYRASIGWEVVECTQSS